MDKTLDLTGYEEDVALMESRGGTWFVYRCEAMDSAELGQLRFLKCGPDCTFKNPPNQFPDAPGLTPGWKYCLVGELPLA